MHSPRSFISRQQQIAQRAWRPLSGRLHRFWRGDWGSLWREAAAAGASQRGRYSEGAASKATRDEAEVKRIEKLLQAGEEGRAAGCVSKTSGVASGPGTVEGLRRLLPSANDVAQPSLTFEAADSGSFRELRSSLAKAIQSQMGRFPRLASPGPSGSRFEHWGTLRHNEAGLEGPR